MQKRSSSSVKVFYLPFDLEGLLALLRQRIPALQRQLPLKRVVLFGSYAKGRQTVASDIDLLSCMPAGLARMPTGWSSAR